MAKNLSVIFNMIDNISSKLTTIGNVGRNAASSFHSIEDSANASFESINNSTDAISASFDRTSSAADSLASAVNECSTEMSSALSSAENLASANSSIEDALEEEAEKVRQTSEEIDGLGDSIGKTKEKTEGLGESTKKTTEETEKFREKSTEAMDSLNNLLVSGGIAAAIHKVAEEFGECATEAEIVETAIAKLQTISGEEHINELTTDIVSLSNETGQAAEALADVAYNAISAGTDVEKSVSMAGTATELAVAGFTDATSALSVLETATNSYGEAAGTAEHISDSLIQVQNLGVTTVAELAAQMGKAISTASAYSVSLENLESGYISITKAGINTAEGTTYISSMLNELGSSSSEVAKVLQDETGKSFGQLMNEGKSLADVLGMIYQSCDNNAEAMMNMWGSAEAGKAANAIIGQGLDTFNENLNTLQTSVGVTAQAYAVMANTTEYAHNKMDNAAKNTQLQIGNVLNPTLTKLYEGMERIYTDVGDFVEKNPTVVKAITAITAGIATFAGGIAAYTTATTIATAVQTAFNGAIMSSPVFWLVGGVAALAGGLVYLASTSEDVTKRLTATAEEHEEKLNSLKKEYEEVCEEHGKNSTEASNLALEIRNLSDSYEHAGETVGEFRQRIESLGESIADTKKTYEDNIKSSDDLYSGTTLLIGQLQALQNQTNLTDSQLSLMKQIVNELNGSYSDLGLTIDEATGKTNFSTQDLFNYAQAQQEQQKIDAASEGLMNALMKYNEVKDAYDESGDNLLKDNEKYNEMEANWATEHPFLSKIGKGRETILNSDVKNQYNQLQESLGAFEEAEKGYNDLNDDIREYCEQLGYSTDETEAFIQQLKDGALNAEESAVKFGQSGEELASYADAVSGGVNSVKAELETLAESYDAAYNDALTSFEGQYALWDKVENKSKTSVDKINQAMQSQIDYWNEYAENLDKLQNRNIDGLPDMLKELDDGSQESAAALSAMANATDEQLEKMVKKYQKLQSAQSKTAEEVGELESDFSTHLDEMSKKLKDSVEKMNMEKDASSAAQKTLQGYINSINSMKGQAVSAAQAVAQATANALKTPTPTKPTSIVGPTLPTKLPGHASGTTNSEKVYVAGEEGPELIISGGGDEVFPHSDTEEIISAVNGKSDNEQVTAPVEMRTTSLTDTSVNGGSNDKNKTITIKLEGAGTINVNAGVSPDDVWENFKGDIKSVFMKLLKEEIFEEGAGAYEF